MSKELLLKTIKKKKKKFRNSGTMEAKCKDMKGGSRLLHIPSMEFSRSKNWITCFPCDAVWKYRKKNTRITFIFKKVSHNKLWYLSKTQRWVTMVHLGTKHKLLLFEKYYCLVFYCLFYCYKTNVHSDFTVAVIILGYRWDRAYEWLFLLTAYWYDHPCEIMSAWWRDAASG